MKIRNFKDLEGVAVRGLTCRVEGMEYKGVTPSYYRINLEGKELTREGFYEGNDLKDCIRCLNEIGFCMIELKDDNPLVLADFLKVSISPIKFRSRAWNRYFLINCTNEITVGCSEELQILNGFYFTFINNGSVGLLESYLKDNKITAEQLYDTLKGLGWV